jgi:hypothetical protein
MKEIMFGGAAVALATGAYFHGPLKSGETYDQPIAEVYRIVEASPLPSLFDKVVYGQRNGAVTRGGEPQKSMIWYFHAKGQQIGKYTVTMSEAGAGKTRVSTSFEMANNAQELMGKGIALYGSDQFKVIGQASMDEQIDSRLDKRPFDGARITEAMAGHMMANMGQIQSDVSASMDHAAAQFDRADADRAYRDGQAANRKYTPGEPMVK